MFFLGFDSGIAVNPAADFGSRIFAAIVYGGNAFSDGNTYFWVPIVGPLIGGALGCLLYDLSVPSTPYDEEKYSYPV
jgi:glycerol uptake facilitator-like aquaporin